ncbi:hypothetical protein [Streptomyces sp. NPDC049555]|uniref:hypothetical protein n=1 Tax=Streptomyces sp. NPDC049555 TaxID=3154930 RepID=UPI00342BFF6A
MRRRAGGYGVRCAGAYGGAGLRVRSAHPCRGLHPGAYGVRHPDTYRVPDTFRVPAARPAPQGAP